MRSTQPLPVSRATEAAPTTTHVHGHPVRRSQRTGLSAAMAAAAVTAAAAPLPAATGLTPPRPERHRAHAENGLWCDGFDGPRAEDALPSPPKSPSPRRGRATDVWQLFHYPQQSQFPRGEALRPVSPSFDNRPGARSVGFCATSPSDGMSWLPPSSTDGPSSSLWAVASPSPLAGGSQWPAGGFGQPPVGLGIDLGGQPTAGHALLPSPSEYALSPRSPRAPVSQAGSVMSGVLAEHLALDAARRDSVFGGQSTDSSPRAPNTRERTPASPFAEATGQVMDWE